MPRYPLSRALMIIGALGIGVLFLAFFHTPRAFVPDTLVAIPPGSSLIEAAHVLEEKKVITSPLLLRIAVLVTGGAESIKAGDYFFRHPIGVLQVAGRLSRGFYDTTALRVLLPEGSSSKEMGVLLARQLPHIDAEMFAREARNHEGYLFPDTYFFLPSATSGDAIAILRRTFDEKTEAFSETASSSERSFADAIIMASLLEEETQTLEDKRIVAGILWKRLDEGMRLQIDAPFVYLLGKASHELTTEDLALDSPYNTYLYEGLPPTPISNPGLESIMAAYDPVATPYWFYLSDADGILHYAETHDEHLENKRLFLE